MFIFSYLFFFKKLINFFLCVNSLQLFKFAFNITVPSSRALLNSQLSNLEAENNERLRSVCLKDNFFSVRPCTLLRRRSTPPIVFILNQIVVFSIKMISLSIKIFSFAVKCRSCSIEFSSVSNELIFVYN